ncbi:hypothetical protein ACQ4PT_060340 [Festuca glaucescens]
MAAAGEEAVRTHTALYSLDLVSFTPGRAISGVLDCGLVLPMTGDDADTFKMLRIDGSLVSKKPDKIAVIDRSTLCVGQIVGSASDIGGQIGVVTGVTTMLDVVRFNSRYQPTKVVMGVPTAGVRRVRALSPGDYVVSGQWLGRVVEVSLDIDVLFDDGAVCRVTDAQWKKLKLAKPRNYRSQMNTAFYPGAHVVTPDSSDIFTDVQWLNGQWKPDRQEGKVTKVEMASVLVYWIACAELGIDQRLLNELAPPAYHNPDDLTYFCSDPDCTWGLGDRCFLSTDHDEQQYTSSQSPVPPPTMTVGNTYTSVDVLWQDGTRQHGAESTDINPLSFTNDFNFFPGQYVVDNSPTHDIIVAAVDGTGDDIVCGSTRRIGVVRSQSSKDHMVNVSWFKAASTSTCWEVECNDIVSAYDLRRDPDHSVFYGDVVVRLLSDVSESTPVVQQQPQEKNASSSLSWVGRVVDLHDGHVQVKWGDSSTSTVLPHEISVANKEHYTQLVRVDEWAEEDDVDAPQADNEQHDPEDATEIEGGMVDGSVSSADEVDGLTAAIQNVEVQEDRNADDDSDEEYDLTVMIKSKDATADDDLSKFPRFDVVKSPPDHHYIDITHEGSSGGRRWVKTVQKEWKILENSLPETIYVRAFEDRMDLLRVVMVGANGTPYHDGLFFFDLQLPPSYPAEPPQVFYHSFGLRLNPNLYESGSVCLSLLNTFGGEGTEVWSPATSSILQVVVSLQALVLNDQPYYNEAGYEELIGKPVGRRDALPYSGNAFLLTLRTALHLLRRTPKGFEEFVRDHFRQRGRYVLETCQAYLREGVPADHGSMELSCSIGFRIALAKLVPMLVAAFTDIGAQGCDHYTVTGDHHQTDVLV